MPRRQDDFVLTISDNDEDGDLDLAEEEESSDDETKTRALDTSKNLKRKRDDVLTNGRGHGNGKQSKHAPAHPQPANGKSKNAKLTAKAKHLDSSDDEEEEGKDDGMLNPDFAFDFGNELGPVVADEEFDGWALASSKESVIKKGVDIDDLVRRRRGGAETTTTAKNEAMNEDDDDEDEEIYVELSDEDEDDDEDGFGRAADLEPESDEDVHSPDQDQDEDEDQDESDADSIASPVPHPDDMSASDSESQIDVEEQRKQAAFFDPSSITITKNGQSTPHSTSSFQGMSLSRPILKGLSSLNFSTPTPIQSQTIPIALLGRDIVGGAVTGSGKTGAFTIPILERLLYRPRKIPVSRVVILMPTRELAVQCFNVARKIASFTDITFALVVGGFSLREQEVSLKSRPDVIVATPGRFIDHMRNSASFSVDGIEILVLDEADRMLEDGFADELNEILSTLPKRRQTMLFSATMTSSVDRLISLGMSKPVRVLVDSTRSTVSTLTQEFVRLRPGRENRRLAALMVLVEQYTSKCIIFFRQKREAHRVRIVFALSGLQAAELHGSMTQEQRIASVEDFRTGKAKFLLATDVASRGLDIKGVETVINFEAPQTHEIYLHRVGRTARAGRSGTAVTIAAEQDRKVVKSAVKAGKSQGASIKSKVLDVGAVDAWFSRLEKMEGEVDEVLSEEKEEKALQATEMSLQKGENMITHEGEIMSRPKRTWFESEKEKREARERGNRELNGGTGDGKKGKKRREMSGKERKREEATRERKEGGERMWKKGKKEREAPRGGQRQRGAKKGGKTRGK